MFLLEEDMFATVSGGLLNLDHWMENAQYCGDYLYYMNGEECSYCDIILLSLLCVILLVSNAYHSLFILAASGYNIHNEQTDKKNGFCISFLLLLALFPFNNQPITEINPRKKT